MAKRPRGASTQAIDTHVGQRLRERRLILGLTQQQLADLLGVTYQQAHKYERGINRLSAGRLAEAARVLNVPVGYFYEGLGLDTPRLVSDRERMSLELVRNFALLSEHEQEAVAHLVRTLLAGPALGARHAA